MGQGPLFAGPEWAAKGRLHFATSDIASSESGWFEGAIIAGEAVAETILGINHL
jgi:monoamine oxidase